LDRYARLFVEFLQRLNAEVGSGRGALQSRMESVARG